VSLELLKNSRSFNRTFLWECSKVWESGNHDRMDRHRKSVYSDHCFKWKARNEGILNLQFIGNHEVGHSFHQKYQFVIF
jgi:hypothetical protein